MRLRCLVAAVALALAANARASPAPSEPSPAPGAPLYLMSGFTDVDGANGPLSEQKLRLFLSDDGRTWRAATPGPVYEDPRAAVGGNVRDPSITYYRGRWWIAYTNDFIAGRVTPQWSLASSPDLLTWTLAGDISTATVSKAFHAWAPEFFLDAEGRPHVFLSISTDGVSDFAIYESHALDLDNLTDWSAPVRLTGTGLPANAIDPFVISQGATYRLFVKDDDSKALVELSSPNLTTGYTIENAHVTPAGANCEGPSVAAAPDHGWLLICDLRTDQGMHVAASVDLSNWSPLAPVDGPYVWNHGTALRLSDPASRRDVLALPGAGDSPAHARP